VLNWRFECEDVENASEEDVEDDGKKRKREASEEEEEEEEEEEKNVLFPILEKDRGGQPPLKVPKFKEPLSLETFMTQFYLPKKPCAMRRFCTHWPAHEKWKDPSYFLDNFGARAVPVEFGSSYSSENWKINVVTFEEFLLKHMTDDKCGAYLAQQTLADQFPKLLEDIREPEYVHGCFREEEEDEGNGGSKINIVAKNFWIGPKNTVSPPHTDPRDNLFVQICGAKRVRLWKPLDTDTDKDDNDDDDDENAMNQNATTTTTMYPYTASSTENTKLTNTSKAGDISLASFSPRAFPRLYRRPFYDVQLDAGDALFIPKGWWHFVKSVSNSISVSYWW
jgi:lysine-specific demethylase 8